MARTLHVLNDKTLQTLGDAIVGMIIAEVKDIFSFASRFNVALTAPASIPAKIDMTDSIVKVVVDDDAVTSMQNQADQQELRSIGAAIKKLNLNVKMPAFQRTALNPDRGGIGWQSKSVLPLGSVKVAIVQTGGVVSIATAVDTTLTFAAPNKWSLDEARSHHDSKVKLAELAHGGDQEKKVKDADAAFEKSKQHWKLKDVAPKNWPPDLQKQISLALGRLIAHEARHQYVAEHFDDGGLGGESAEVLGVQSSERFLEDDRKQISAQLDTFDRLQRTAGLQLETFPKDQPFAFAESD